MRLSKEDYERLVKLAAQSEFLAQALKSAEKRAEDAESALASERSGKDWLVNQLSSRVITKHGGYGLDHKPQKPSEPDAPKNPNGFIRDPSVIDLAKLEYYKQCYRDAGMPEEKAELRWEAEMRGEVVPFEFEMETEN